jgi:hypothetical protein
VFANWTETAAGTSTVNDDTDAGDFHGGAHACRLDVDAGGSNVIVQQVLGVANQWSRHSFWMKSSAAGKTGRYDTNSYPSLGPIRDPGTTYTQYTQTALGAGTGGPGRQSAASASLYYDDVSVKQLTFSELITPVETNSADVLSDVAITGVNGYQAGLVLRLDSISSPANYLLALLWQNAGGAGVGLYKCVAGTYTQLITAAVTYVAGATLRGICDGSAVSVFYNNLLVGTTQTVSDAGILNNTLHGLFSTDASNSLDNLLIMPRGNAGEFAGLNNFIKGG